MNDEQILAEIREANLTYLMLAQTLIRKDKAEAVFRLGLSEEACDILGTLSAAQILKIDLPQAVAEAPCWAWIAAR